MRMCIARTSVSRGNRAVRIGEHLDIPYPSLRRVIKTEEVELLLLTDAHIRMASWEVAERGRAPLCSFDHKERWAGHLGPFEDTMV